MAKKLINIKRISDSYECETCGMNWADGAIATVAKSDIEKINGLSAEQINIFDVNFISEKFIDNNFVPFYATFTVLYNERKLKLYLDSELKRKLQTTYFKPLSIVECSPFFGFDNDDYMKCDFLNVFRYQGFHFVENVLGLSINDFKIKRIDNVKYENDILSVNIVIEQRW